MINVEGRHPSTQRFAPLFKYEHLADEELQRVSALSASLAASMIDALPDGPELSSGLRKLVEAKDCFVRAAVLARPTPPGPNQPGK